MSIKSIARNLYHKESGFLKVAMSVYNHLPFNNKIMVSGNTLKLKTACLKKCTLEIFGGANLITIEDGCQLNRCVLHINGNNNSITLQKSVAAKDTEFWIEGDGNCIFVGEKTTFEGKTHLACIEGTSIEIGKDCMFSANIVFRTGDSHSIIDSDGKRINPAKNISMGNHVWVGNTVIVNKGVAVSDNSIIGTGSVVTKQFEKSGIAIAGNPAREVKEQISWLRQRI